MKRTPGEADRMLQVMERFVADFRRDAAVLHRAVVDGMPGYPTSTLAGPGSSGGQVSDPTARFALQGDTSARDLDQWYSALDNGYQWLLEASYVRSRHLPAMSTVKRCGNPAGCPRRALAATDRRGLCEPCYRNGVRIGSAAA